MHETGLLRREPNEGEVGGTGGHSPFQPDPLGRPSLSPHTPMRAAHKIAPSGPVQHTLADGKAGGLMNEIGRRGFLAGAGGLALAAPRIAHAEAARVLRFVPQTDAPVLDPTGSTAAVTRNHGFMVYDTLYGLDASYQPQPQMVAGDETAPDGLTWRLTLRDGLVFHDGKPVLARDAVASLRRWGRRDGFGQALMAATNELSAHGDRVIQFRLKRPFPLLRQALGKVSSYVPFIMPERIAATEAGGPLTEIVGSGPFRFVADEHVSGSRLVYARHTGYLPRPDGIPSQAAGPKRVFVDRVEWVVMPDPATSTAALQKGEVDWWEAPTADLSSLLRRDRAITLAVLDPLGEIAILRFNQRHAPFDNPAIRHALLGAVDQADFMTVVAGDNPKLWNGHVGVFCPGTPFATEAGMEVLSGKRDAARAAAAIRAAGYAGQKIVFLQPADSPETAALSDVGADLLKRCGFNVDVQTSDLSSAMQRRTSTAPERVASWDCFITRFGSLDLSSPATNLLLRGNGMQAWAGWPDDPAMEALRSQWFEAPDLAAQKTIAAGMQERAMQNVPYVPLGQYLRETAYRRNLTGMLTGLPLFWNIEKS